MQELAALGQELLTTGDEGNGMAKVSETGSSGGMAHGAMPTEVLLSAARQHLMSAEVSNMQFTRVALLLADYQQLAASYYAHVMLSR